MSLRTRLLLAVSAIALLALVIADITVYTSLRSFLYQQTDSTLETSHMAVESAATAPNFPNPGPSGIAGGPSASSSFCAVGRESAPGMFIEVRGTTGSVVSGEDCPAFQPGSQTYTPKLPATFHGYKTTTPDRDEPTVYLTVASSEAGGPAFRVRASILINGGVLIIADPIGGIDSTLQRLLLVELAVTLGALIFAIAFGRSLVSIGLRPLRDVERTAEAIAEGDLMHRVPNAHPRTEVGHVASALNVMLERIEVTFGELQASENRLRRFVSDASHELRTPIAAVSAYAQLFKRGAAQHEDDLARVMEGVERESARMARLVEDLLTLTKFDEHQVIERDVVELVGLAAEAIETARLVGPAWPIVFLANEPVEVMGDRTALRQVLDNLLANVRAHTPPGTTVTISVSRSDELATVEVRDDGPGLSEELAEHVFERFFRADASRSRATGGAGLGLAIVASIVRAHNGSVRAEANKDGGARFIVTLPAMSRDQDAS